MLTDFTATDFDGTIFEEAWPAIGKPIPKVIAWLKNEQKQGKKIGLWTCREGAMLVEAVNACAEQGLYFDCINKNLPERIELFSTDPRKIGADHYLDDKAITVESILHPVPTWTSVEDVFPEEFKEDGSINWVLTSNDCVGWPPRVRRRYKGRWVDDLSSSKGAPVTHWMPLPEEPTTKTRHLGQDVTCDHVYIVEGK